MGSISASTLVLLVLCSHGLLVGALAPLPEETVLRASTCEGIRDALHVVKSQADPSRRYAILLACGGAYNCNNLANRAMGLTFDRLELTVAATVSIRPDYACVAGDSRPTLFATNRPNLEILRVESADGAPRLSLENVIIDCSGVRRGIRADTNAGRLSLTNVDVRNCLSDDPSLNFLKGFREVASGAALLALDTVVRVDGGRFINNTASTAYDLAAATGEPQRLPDSGQGGAIAVGRSFPRLGYHQIPRCVLDVQNAAFEKNQAAGFGGAIYVWEANGLKSDTVTCRGCVFTGNSAGRGCTSVYTHRVDWRAGPKPGAGLTVNIAGSTFDGRASSAVMCGYAGVITSSGQPVGFRKTALKLPRPPARPLVAIRQTPTPSLNDYEVRLP